MFRPARLLQAASLLAALTACAATPPSTNAIATTPAGASSDMTNQPGSDKKSTVQLVADLSPLAPAVSIKAGASIPGNVPFTQTVGVLQPDIKAYAQEVANARGVPLAHVENLLLNARYDAEAARLMAPSGTRIRRSWVTYRNRFVDPVRIEAGQRFWQENQAALSRTAEQYGVPASIIVAIIGVETIYGRYTGNFRVLDALATLGFRYPDPKRPERSQLFRDQLADLIQLDAQGQVDALQATGSYAGAMGLPQFMPGSLLRYAADGNGDGQIELHESAEDAIASVARFLRLHGWVPGLPVFAPATLPRDPASFVTGGLDPTLDWSTLQAAGARASSNDGGWQQYKVGMVNLVDEPRNTVEYRIGTPNFFAITHYNRSYFYATSVADLARTLEDRMTVAVQ